MQNKNKTVITSAGNPDDVAQLNGGTQDLPVEQSSLENESGLRRIIDSIPNLIWSASPDGTINYLNQGWVSFTGMTQTEAQGTGWMQSIHPDDLEITNQKWNEAIRAGTFLEMEQRLRRFDGEFRWFLTRAQPVRDSAGKVLRWYGVNTDITERKLAEKILQENEHLFRASFENATIGVSLVSPAGRFLRVNKVLCNILGYTADELAGMTFNDVTYQDDKAIGTSLVKQVIAGELESASLEKRYNHKDGHLVWVHISFAPIRSEAGELQYLVTHTQDISERKQTEEKLRQHSRAVESSPVSIVISNIAGDIEYVNPRFTELTGYSFEEALGHNPRMLQSGYTSRGEYQKLWETILSGEVWRGEFRNRKKNGELYWENASISPIMDENGTVTHFVAVKENITGRKRDHELITEALAFNQTILATSPIGIITYNAAGNCISANQAAGLILGADPQVLLTQNFHTLLPWKESGLHAAAMQALAASEPVSSQFHYYSSFGKDLWLSITLVSFKTGGENNLLVMFQDDSKRQMAEHLLKLSNEKLEGVVKNLERSKQEADLLRQMSDLLQVCNKAQQAYDVVGQFAPQIFENCAGAIFIIDPTFQIAEAVSTWGNNLASELVFGVENCLALRLGRVHPINSALPGLNCQHIDPDFVGSYLDIPLSTSGETLGLLHLENLQAAGIDEGRQASAKIFGDNVSISLSNIKLRERLHEQSVRDPLTHAFNRRYMEETLNRDLPRARRKNSQVGLIMLDIDYFKTFNDTYGHAAGDLVLTSLSGLLQSHVRGEDIVCRMGGEEFLMILPDAGLEVTLQRAELIRADVEGLKLEYDHHFLGTINVSLGVSVYPDHGNNCAEILGKADAALYCAKHNGRNRVEISPDSQI